MALSSNSRSAATWNASGEATPSAPLPEKFVPTARSTNAINGSVAYAPDWNGNVQREPIVQRAARTVGMKYLYVDGATPVPVHPLGADGPPYPFRSGFQRNIVGLIHNAGFNYALYQAGYPGYNLGLSFKVPTITDEQGRNLTGGPGMSIASGPRNIKGGSRGTTRIGRMMGRGGV